MTWKMRLNLFWQAASLVMIGLSTWALIHHEIDWASLFMLWSIALKTNRED
jgi:hypothetical protein